MFKKKCKRPSSNLIVFIQLVVIKNPPGKQKHIPVGTFELMIFQNPVSQVSPPSLPVAALEFELGPSDILVQGLRPRACCERMEHPMASPCEKRNAPLKLSLSAVACTKSNTIQNMLTLHVATIHMNSFKFGISGLQNKGLKVFLSDSCPKEPQGATPWGASFYWKHVMTCVSHYYQFTLQKTRKHIPPNGKPCAGKSSTAWHLLSASLGSLGA